MKASAARRSIVRLDRALDNFGLGDDEFRHVVFHVVRGQAHRLIGAGLVLKDAERLPIAKSGQGCNLLSAGIKIRQVNADSMCTNYRIGIHNRP